jgi:hypothetical protein
MRKCPLSLLTSILTSQWQRLGHLHRKPEVLCRCPRAALLRALDPFVLCGYVRGLVPRGLLYFGDSMRSGRKTHRLLTIRGPAVTLRRQCRQALPSSRRACVHLSLRLATAFCPQAKTLPLSSSLNSKPRAEATMLPRNDLTFATLIRTRASALTAGSALKSSMTSDNLLRFWPWALCATEARRHAENRGGLQKYPGSGCHTGHHPRTQRPQAWRRKTPSPRGLTSSPMRLLEALRLPRGCWRLFASSNCVGELVTTAIRTPALFIAHTTSSKPGRDGTPPEAGHSACSCNGKTSSTRMSIPKCSSVVRAESGAAGAAAAATAPRARRAAGDGDERGRGRRVPRLRTREGRRTVFALVSRNGASRSPLFNAAFSRKRSIRRRLQSPGFCRRPRRPTACRVFK